MMTDQQYEAAHTAKLKKEMNGLILSFNAGKRMHNGRVITWMMKADKRRINELKAILAKR